MRSNGYEYQSEFARRYVQQGREEVLAENRKKGREQGWKTGFLKGLRNGLFMVLQAQGLKVGSTARRQLMACTDPTQLERWLSRAVKVQSVQELFQSGVRSRPSARKTGARPPGAKARKPRARR